MLTLYCEKKEVSIVCPKSKNSHRLVAVLFVVCNFGLLICHPGGAHLQLQLVCDQRDELGVRRLTLRVADSISKEPL